MLPVAKAISESGIFGKKDEAKSLVETSLAKDPERVPTRTNAGWAALQRGDLKEAKEHFLEVLRLDPNNQYNTTAKEGLLQSFKAQSWLYRLYLKFTFFAEKFSDRQRLWFFIIIPIVLIKLLPAFSVNRWAITLAGSAIALYWLLFLWGHIAESVGNLILLKDEFARKILSLREKQVAIVTGVSLTGGPVLMALGYSFEKNVVIVLGAWLFAWMIPLNFWNNSEIKIEQIVFRTVSFLYVIIIFVLGLRAFQESNFKTSQTIALSLAAFILPALLSWLRLFFRRKT